jgi:hypothetical protein
VVPNALNRVQREKSFNPKKSQIEPTNTSPKGSRSISGRVVFLGGIKFDGSLGRVIIGPGPSGTVPGMLVLSELFVLGNALFVDMTRQLVGTVEPTTTTPAVVPNALNRVQREKSFNPKKSQIEPTNTSPKGSATDKKAAIATVNPYTDENPKILQENTRASDDIREDLLLSELFVLGNALFVPGGTMLELAFALINGFSVANDTDFLILSSRMSSDALVFS